MSKYLKYFANLVKPFWDTWYTQTAFSCYSLWPCRWKWHVHPKHCQHNVLLHGGNNQKSNPYHTSISCFL